MPRVADSGKLRVADSIPHWIVIEALAKGPEPFNLIKIEINLN